MIPYSKMKKGSLATFIATSIGALVIFVFGIAITALLIMYGWNLIAPIIVKSAPHITYLQGVGVTILLTIIKILIK